ncbi:hypothetical protein [Massilia sp. PWRC2]|uniref:hypothetical protein n=1 Tax=Massilia sp. PWRC2 TaxID=2804626 RepID=UPI003CFA5F28
MKLLSIWAFFLVGLAGCSNEPFDPAGTYRFKSQNKILVLSVNADRSYSIEVKESNSDSYWIRGRWQSEDIKEKTISFSGIIWVGIVPHAGNGFWIAKLDGQPAQICLDGEQLECFHKQ